jgi:thioredoxin-related protein
LIAILFSVVAIKYVFFSSEKNDVSLGQRVTNQSSSSVPKPSVQTPVGKTVPLLDVDWKENKKTLILYMSTTCRFCKESSPFYQKLVKETASNNVKFLAVLPQDVDEAKDYFKTEKVEVKDVYKSSLSSIGVVATPILLLVNEEGVVSEFWRGKLPPEKETEVIAKLVS